MLSILHPSSPGRRYCYSHFIEGDLGLKILGRLIGLTQVILLELRHHLRLSGTKHEFKDFFNLTFLKRQYIHSVQNFKTTYKCTKKPQTLFYPLSPPIDRQYNKLPKDLSKRYIMHILANRGCVCVCVCVCAHKKTFFCSLLAVENVEHIQKHTDPILEPPGPHPPASTSISSRTVPLQPHPTCPLPDIIAFHL